jgi:hypothetical protein
MFDIVIRGSLERGHEALRFPGVSSMESSNMKYDIEAMEMIVHPECPKGKLAAAEMVAKSANEGLVFRHLLSGWRKAHHALIIAEIACKLVELGKDAGEIAYVLNMPHVQATNNSQWTQWLDNAVAVRVDAESGKWVTLSTLHADGSSASTELDLI